MQTKTITKIAMIAAVYTAVSTVLAPISYGPIQVRIAEALTMLPLIFKPSIIGLTIGCAITNLIGAITGFNPTGFIDSIIGSFATLVAAYCTYKFKDNKVKGIPLISILSPVFFNFLIVGAELAYFLMRDNFLVGTLIMGSEVAVGELISVVIGYVLIKALERSHLFDE